MERLVRVLYRYTIGLYARPILGANLINSTKVRIMN
jgi:hypothetical protein